MPRIPKPPTAYTKFSEQFPLLGKAWEQVHEAGAKGPLDEKTQRLVKMAAAMGAMREGAVHSSVRKAASVGITEEEILQVVALAAGVLGFPSTVAIYTWTQDKR